MHSPAAIGCSAPLRSRRFTLVGVLLAVALLLAVLHIHAALDGASFWSLLVTPDHANIRDVLVRESLLPRIAMTVLCGAALGLAGVLAQQVLRNPLAEPMTLGIFPGAYLALMIATIWMPAWLSAGREVIALAGGALAMLAVFALAWRQRMSPLAVILSGMVVNLYCGAIILAITMVHFDLLSGLMIWGGGSLDQTDWQASLHLLPRFALCAVATWLLSSPLGAFNTGDSNARNLGIPVARIRFAALLIAVSLTAFVVSTVGVIGFIGLAAPTLAKLCGARRLHDKLIWGPLIGAVFLWATDEIVRTISSAEMFSAHLIPTGTVTALLGVPLLIALLPRLCSHPEIGGTPSWDVPSVRLGRRVPLILALLAVACVMSIVVSREPGGWRLASFQQIGTLLFWRLPHLVSALAAGVLLAVAGTLVQRMTANPMASPDLLGVGSGGALGIVVTLFIIMQPGPGLLFAGCIAGAVTTLFVLLWLGQRVAFAPERLLLVGISISALFQAVVGAVMSSGDPRIGLLMNFIVGSTYYVQPAAAWGAAMLAVLALCVAPLNVRWIETLGLGAPVASGLGVPVARARFVVLLLAATLTAASTLLVGPLSFVGLIAPHIARMSGGRRPLAQIWMSAVLGAALMVISEWVGRQILFPQEMPAGLVATLLGGPYVIALMLRGRGRHAH